MPENYAGRASLKIVYFCPVSNSWVERVAVLLARGRKPLVHAQSSLEPVKFLPDGPDFRTIIFAVPTVLLELRLFWTAMFSQTSEERIDDGSA